MSRLAVSFEVFPARDAAARRRLLAAVDRLARFRPRFVSVTYGAGGSNQSASLATLEALGQRRGLTRAAHVTGIGADPDRIAALAEAFWSEGIRRLVVLRGDLPDEAPEAAGAFPQAVDLVRFLARLRPFRMAVAAYPETHPEAASPATDLAALKAKLDAGAEEAITQFFFEAETFLRFRDRAEAAGIDAPIVPGLMPIHDLDGVARFAKRCGASLPAVLAARFAAQRGDPAGLHALAVDSCLELAERLIAEGVPGLHFYSLNRAGLVAPICQGLGLEEPPSARFGAAKAEHDASPALT